MIEIYKRASHRSEDSCLCYSPVHPRFSHATWVAVAVGGSALIGAGAAAYGANKQAQSVKDTNAANQSSVAAANANDWNNYLLQRGVNAGGTAAPGQIPSNAVPTNTRLPLWMNVQQNAPSATAPLFIKKGAAPSASPGYSLNTTIPTVQPIADPNAAIGSAGGSKGGLTNTQKVIGLIDPSMALIGGKRSSWYDPIGLFG